MISHCQEISDHPLNLLLLEIYMGKDVLITSYIYQIGLHLCTTNKCIKYYPSRPKEHSVHKMQCLQFLQ